MKKLVVSALLIVLLLLGTASPVLAATNYTVSIPSELSIDLMSKTPNVALSKGEVKLIELKGGGSVDVIATATKIVLKNGTINKDEIPVKLTNGVTSDKLDSFSLSRNQQLTQPIRIETDEISQNHLPGEYVGLITFTFNYVK